LRFKYNFYVKGNIEEFAPLFTKTIKAAQIYGTSHPTFLNFYTPCYQSLVSFLRENHNLTLQIERFTIHYAGQIIYEEREKDLSIAFRLFRDGIREINFIDGLNSDEFMIFLETISRSAKEQDIALNLWECDLSHINFYVVEEEEEDLGYKIPEMPEFNNIDYEERFYEILKKEAIDLAEPVNPEISAEELKLIKTEIVESEKRPLIGMAINTLTNILKTEPSPLVIESLIEILELCINKQDFNNASRIVERLKDYPEINVLQRFENEITIISFANFVNTISDRTFNDFVAFVGFFPKRSVPHFLKMITAVAKRERADLLRARLAYICQDDIEPVLGSLKNSNLKVVTNAILILGMMKRKEAILHLQEFFFHPEEDIRIAVIQTVAEIGEIKLIPQFIDDPSPRVRIKALQTLTQHRYPRVYNKILEKIKKSSFFEIELPEQKEYFNCLVANGDKKLIKDLEKMLFKWVLFGRKRYQIIRRLSAQALAQISDEDALKILKTGARKRNRDIKTACEQALKLIQQ